MGQQSLIYSFVARGTVILAEYTEFTGNFTSIASQCLQKLPASNNKFTYNCDGHTFNYLVENGFSESPPPPPFSFFLPFFSSNLSISLRLRIHPSDLRRFDPFSNLIHALFICIHDSITVILLLLCVCVCVVEPDCCIGSYHFVILRCFGDPKLSCYRKKKGNCARKNLKNSNVLLLLLLLRKGRAAYMSFPLLPLSAFALSSPIMIILITYCVVAAESAGRQIPIAYLERIKDDFNKRYAGGKAGTATANGLNREFGPKLKEHMKYCGVMMENIEKVLDRGEKIELLVDKTDNLRSQAQDFKQQGTKMRRKMWFQNMKMKLIVVGIVVALGLVIFLSACGGFKCVSD
ncbi:putative Longin-like domain-containing protein [Rosa chinensis]|uniref:Putative Longin-like domain-containing protein n=1 Tax=Rosa chinensis TaxID=74649 RepID=A0A2P6QNX2_ROSCH|nr:putative Longin-like domain-containing protein [Rosa chinensis]